MKNYRIAIPTKGKDGLEDVVSDVFGKANTFTIVDTINEKMDLVKVIENPAKSYIRGCGPIVVKMLIDVGVELVLAYELGLGAQALLKQNNIEHIPVMPKTKVREAVELAIHSLKKRRLCMKSEKEIRKRLDQLMQQRMYGGPFSELKGIAGHRTKQALEWILEETESPITYK